MIPEYISVDKPSDWPASQREANLEDAFCVLVNFIKEPTYKNKELLYSIISQSDLNEINNTGLFRITKYEVALMNSIYEYSCLIHCESMKIFLYRFIATTAQMYKMYFYTFDMLNKSLDFIIKEYMGLFKQLYLFYISYAKFNYEKKQSFCDAIIENINDNLSLINNDSNLLFDLAHTYIMMLKDLSEFKSSKTFQILTFSREEIYQLLELESYLIDLSKQDLLYIPLRSVLILTIRNWILRSRNGYDEKYFYKCISDENAKLALSNHEVWMKKIEKLNDPRETKIMEELIIDNSWKKYNWAHNIRINSPQNHFVCSYTKTLPNEDMKKEYGNNVFGYKTDRISDIFTPISLYNDHVFLEDVLYYDVIYSCSEAKSELNYLCDIINLYSFSDKQKEEFLNEILQYWYLSFKDEKWKNENERRYHIILNNSRKNIDSKIEGDYYKSKTSIYLYPDFLLSSNSIKNIVKSYRDDKIKAISTKSYLFCNNCLQSDYDYITRDPKNKCIVCGSKDIKIIEIF